MSFTKPPNLCPNLVSTVLIGSANSVFVSKDWNLRKLSINVDIPNLIVTLPLISINPCGVKSVKPFLFLVDLLTDCSVEALNLTLSCLSKYVEKNNAGLVKYIASATANG